MFPASATCFGLLQTYQTYPLSKECNPLRQSLDAFEVTGGLSLHGDITPQGAKNEALQVLCAVLLTEEEVDNLVAFMLTQ